MRERSSQTIFCCPITRKYSASISSSVCSGLRCFAVHSVAIIVPRPLTVMPPPSDTMSVETTSKPSTSAKYGSYSSIACARSLRSVSPTVEP